MDFGRLRFILPVPRSERLEAHYDHLVGGAGASRTRSAGFEYEYRPDRGGAGRMGDVPFEVVQGRLTIAGQEFDLFGPPTTVLLSRRGEIVFVRTEGGPR